MTVVTAIYSVVNARTTPIINVIKLIKPIISLDKSFILADICIIAEKQNEEKAMKNTKVLRLLNTELLISATKVFLSFVFLVFPFTFTIPFNRLTQGWRSFNRLLHTAIKAKTKVGAITSRTNNIQ